jgi:hypothetical protein
MRAMLLWVRPDMSAFASFIGSVTAETYIARDHVKLVNENLLTLQATSTLGLEFPKLDYASLQLVSYVDGSFANREDKSSQIGFVTCLVDKNGRICILSYRSCKAWTVCRSAMASETLALLLDLMRHSLYDTSCQNSWDVRFGC